MSGTPTFYIFHGDDSISLRGQLAKMRAALGEDGDLNCAEFEGASAPLPEVLAAAKSLPFLAEKRLVIVKGLISHITRRGAGQAGRAAADRLIDELPRLPDYARLVLVEAGSLSEKNRVLTAARSLQNGYVAQFRQPQNLTRWLMARARDEYDAEITPEAAGAIASVVDDDLLLADNELHKLVTYVDSERAITEDDVAALTPYLPQANIFELVDALAVGDGARALELIQRATHDDPRDPGFRLFGMIARQFRLLLMTRDHLDRGGGAGPDAIAQAVGISRFPARKLAVQARRFQRAQLDAILKRLQRYDQDMKTGRINPRLALDVLVASLSRE